MVIINVHFACMTEPPRWYRVARRDLPGGIFRVPRETRRRRQTRYLISMWLETQETDRDRDRIKMIVQIPSLLALELPSEFVSANRQRAMREVMEASIIPARRWRGTPGAAMQRKALWASTRRLSGWRYPSHE